MPIMVQVTIETTGTLLVGADIAAAATIIHALDVPVIGLNCATGPQEMAEHVKWLGRELAGPDLGAAQRRPAGAGRRQDALSADAGRAGEVARALRRRGRRQHDRRLLRHRRASTSPRSTRCCASGPAPSAARCRARASRCGCRRSPRSTARCRCARRTPISRSASAATPTARRQFRKLQEEGDWDGCVEMGREQVSEGSHALDVCTAFVGRDEIAEMNEVVSRMRGSVDGAAGHRLDRAARCSKPRSSSTAARRSSTRSTSRTARSRRRSAWSSRAASAPR